MIPHLLNWLFTHFLNWLSRHPFQMGTAGQWAGAIGSFGVLLRLFQTEDRISRLLEEVLHVQHLAIIHIAPSKHCPGVQELEYTLTFYYYDVPRLPAWLGNRLARMEEVSYLSNENAPSTYVRIVCATYASQKYVEKYLRRYKISFFPSCKALLTDFKKKHGPPLTEFQAAMVEIAKDPSIPVDVSKVREISEEEIKSKARKNESSDSKNRTI
jgi:hypothetical protein